MFIDCNETYPDAVVDAHLARLTGNTSLNDSNIISLDRDMVFNNGHLILIIVYSIMIVVSSIGNITVLVLLLKRRLASPSRIDMMLMHLAIADLLVTLLMMPIDIGWAWHVSWQSSDFMCRICQFFRVFGLYLSSFVIICISIDRYYAIKRPLNLSGADRRGRIMLTIAWMGAILFSSPQLIIFSVRPHCVHRWYKQCVTYGSYSHPLLEKLYNIMATCLLYILPLIVIIYCYIAIYMEIYKRSHESITMHFRRSSDDVLGRAKRKTLRMTITIVIVFILCWTPYYFMCIWFFIDKTIARDTPHWVQKSFFLFASVNSCMNPIVYGIYNIPRRTIRNNTDMNTSIRHSSISKTVEMNSRPENARRAIFVNSLTQAQRRQQLNYSIKLNQEKKIESLK